MVNESNHVREAVKKAVSEGKDPEAVIWAFVEGAASVIDKGKDVAKAGLGVGSAQLIVNAFKYSMGEVLAPNPWFVLYGHDDKLSLYTAKYMKSQARTGMAGGAFALGGVALSQVTQADLAGVAQHGFALRSTIAHLNQFRALAKGYKNSQTLTGWIDLLIKMKMLKAGVRGTQLAGAAIPVGSVGLVTGIASAAARLGITMTLTNTCIMTAVELHWRAFQEQIISARIWSGNSDKAGPASAMLHELFARKSIYRIYSSFDVGKIIREPAGWKAVNQRLMLV